MAGSEWSRSRYWLCHFLHSRHVRLTISWEQQQPRPSPADPAQLEAAAELARSRADQHLLIRKALDRCASDPAFIQALRLYVKEMQYHGRLGQQWHDWLTAGSSLFQGLSPQHSARHCPPPACVPLRLQNLLDFRRLLSLHLLWQLLRVRAWEQLPLARPCPAVETLFQQLRADWAHHREFLVERLVVDYAQVNFILRNLRRWRLRACFAGLMLIMLWQLRTTLNNWPARRRFIESAWADFNQLLQRIVPFHRRELLHMLTQQRENPYARARVSL